jgi:multisubunit Na+/H+ antiporter MnhG subunit
MVSSRYISLSRGRTTILWLTVAAVLFSSSTSTWRDLVSSPAGTIVHTFVKGNELVPALKGLALTSILIALISLFANRLIVLVFSSITGLFALATLVTALPKMGAGTLQVGVTARFFWLPEAVGFLGIVITMVLALITPFSAKAWTHARYQRDSKPIPGSLDLWRAQDAGTDPTQDG